jgi:hypothetical protein
MPRALLLAGAALAAAGLLGTGVAAAASADEVPRGTVVRDVELGGLTRSEAVDRLDGSLTAERTTPVSLLAGGESLSLDPVRAGLELDVEATVDDAMDAGWAGRLRALVGAERDVTPVPAFDDVALTGALDELATSFDREPREGSISFDDKAEPVVVQPVIGRKLDVGGAAQAVRAAYLDPEVEVPVQLAEVETTPEEVQEAVETIAQPAMAAPITVDVEGDELVVEPVDLAAALTIGLVDGELVPQLDGAVLRERLTGRLVTVGPAGHRRHLRRVERHPGRRALQARPLGVRRRPARRGPDRADRPSAAPGVRAAHGVAARLTTGGRRRSRACAR